MNKFFKEFNDLTLGEFEYLRFPKAAVDIRAGVVKIEAYCPEERYRDAQNAFDKISAAAARIIGSGVRVETALKKAHFDCDFVRSSIKEFLHKYPEVDGNLKEGDTVVAEDAGICTVTFCMNGGLAAYCEGNFKRELKIYLEDRYFKTFEIVIKAVKQSQTSDTDVSRSIIPLSTQVLLGRPVDVPAHYVEDAKEGRDAVFCGTAQNCVEALSKKQEGKKQRRYIRFELKGFEGRLNTLCFPPSQVTASDLENRVIITRGEVKQDNRGLIYFASDISYCELERDYADMRPCRPVSEHYQYVFPKPYLVQQSMFAKPSDALKGAVYCVFDVETTGLNPKTDKIIEIGAVKIVNGELTETFSALIDPQMPVPERITEITGIKNDDLKGQYTISQVLPDFYKFCCGTVLVGHNVEFDHSFISAAGAGEDIYFTGEKIDTLQLSIKYLPNLSHHNLGTVAKYFGIINENAHRALDDAITTAGIFIKLMS